MKPPIKWVGGKTRLLPELVKRIPKTFGPYYEPFLGGGALFFELHDRILGLEARLSDVNSALINGYQHLKNDPRRLVDQLRLLAAEHGPAAYLAARARFNESGRRYRWGLDDAAMFFYLNRACFNGLWRENAKGEFNAPMGTAKNLVPVHQLLSAARALGVASLAHRDIRSFGFEHPPHGAFVYFDPPYDPISPTSSFAGYSSAGFSDDDQVELASLVRRLSRNGVQVMASNADTPFIRALYRGFQIDRVMAPRSVGAAASTRKKVGEVIITSDYERRGAR